jgi:hypothetical protein
MKSNPTKISDEFLAQLKENLVCRRVGRGMELLERQRNLPLCLIRKKRMPGVWEVVLRNGVDLGFHRPALVKEILASFSKTIRARLPPHDYLYLPVAEGMAAMATMA